MSKAPFIYISSDDSSDSEIKYYSDSDSDSNQGWSNYFPPIASSSTNQKPKKKVSTAAKATPLSKELPQALTQALESALKNMNIPVEEKPARPEKPPKQVLFLACPRKQSSYDNKRKNAQ